MRVLIVTNTYAPHLNGQAVFATNMAEGLAAGNHQVLVVVPGLDRPESEIRNGVRIQSAPALDLRFIHTDFAFSWRYHSLVKKIFQDFKPQVIHLQDSAPLSQKIMHEAKKRNIPVVATHHIGPAVWAPYFSGKSRFVRSLVAPVIWKWLIDYLNQADVVTVPSRASARMLLAHRLKAHVKPISCGVKLAEFDSMTEKDKTVTRSKFRLPADKLLYVYVGRIDEEKKVELFIEAIRLNCNKNVHAVIAGDGSRLQSLKEIAEDAGINERVHFLGKVQRNDLRALYSACDVFVMPGDVESLSIATLEAMANSKPVIAADAMALPELVEPEKNGLLFRPGDAQNLAVKIDRMAEKKASWAQMGKANQMKVKQHDFRLTVARYELFYQKQVRNASRKAEAKPLVQLPRSLMNPYVWFVVAQWVVTLLIIFVSLFTQNRTVLAAPTSMENFGPRMVESIQQLFTALKHLDLPSNQANGMLVLNNNLKVLLENIGQ